MHVRVFKIHWRIEKFVALIHFYLLNLIFHLIFQPTYSKCRGATGFSNPGGLAVMWWAYAPLVVIGLTELPNSGWAKAHPAHTLAAALYHKIQVPSLCSKHLCVLKRYNY